MATWAMPPPGPQPVFQESNSTDFIEHKLRVLITFGSVNELFYSHCIIAVITCVLNMASESCVLYFLSVLKKNRGSSLGLRLSFQLCIAETCICMWSLVVMVLGTAMPASVVSKRIVEYIVTMIATLFASVVYMLKILVAFNEVLKVFLNLRYGTMHPAYIKFHLSI